MTRRRAYRIGTVVAAAVAAAWPVLVFPAPARAQSPASVTLAGHGFGHGVGMGQWGALGYALAGQPYGWILDHFYGGTTTGTAPNGPIRVRLVGNDGNDVIVTSGAPFSAAGMSMAAGRAVLMHLTSPGSWTISTGPGCAGPWTPAGTASDTGGSGPQAVATSSADAASATTTSALQLCRGGGNLYVRGSLQGAEIGGVARTVNVLPLEQYLRGVVPGESSPSWGAQGSAGAQGQPRGFQALEAQAVAARAYAANQEAAPSPQGGTGAYGYADICDTTACQVYGGMGAENPTTDAAVSATAGQVRVDGSGAVSLTQYSSSTGGWTAGGPFPAVVDDGDAVCTANACNPNHSWSVTVPAQSIQSAYPSIGTFESLQVTSRSGPAQADQGGRVASLVVQGSAGSATTTGATFAARLGLKSSWFAVVGAPSGGIDGYWVGAADGGVFSFGAAAFHGSTGGMRLNRPVVGMAGTPTGRGYWLVASDGGIFTFGDASFHGSTGSMRLNAPVVAMAPTADGRGYWLVASDGGIFTFGDAVFHGSTGASRPVAPVVGMAATHGGGGYWLVTADGSLYPFGDAHAFPPAATTSAAPTGAHPAAASAVAPTADDRGYWLLRRDGTVDAFGDAPPYGPAPVGSDPAVGLAATPDGGGYLVVTAAGNVFSFGDAPNFGSVRDQVPGYSGRALAVAGHPGS
ncbi:MAG TPA: SpoIID/LytB domain-containing protein [Acidimicrobiales bacterium]|nr:SpoIID/LytB domain-containing protein [Acidimicrobiales bacterium]